MTEKSKDMGITVDGVEASDPTVVEEAVVTTDPNAGDGDGDGGDDGGSGAVIGGVVGGVAGLGLIGGGVYMMNKKKSYQGQD